jgi:hypothetical protein
MRALSCCVLRLPFRSQDGVSLRWKRLIFHQSTSSDLAFAAHHALLAAHGNRDHVLTGGLIGYSTSISGGYQLSSIKAASRCGTVGRACAGTICRRDTLLIAPSPDRLITL